MFLTEENTQTIDWLTFFHMWHAYFTWLQPSKLKCYLKVHSNFLYPTADLSTRNERLQNSYNLQNGLLHVVVTVQNGLSYMGKVQYIILVAKLIKIKMTSL